MRLRLGLLLTFLLWCSVALHAQTCTPTNGVICTPNLNLWLPPHGFPDWDTVVNQNMIILDTVVPRTTNILAGNGTGKTVATGLQGQSGWLSGQVLISTGYANANPIPKAVNGQGSLRWIQPNTPEPEGLTIPNGATAIFGNSPSTTNGGVQLWGGNTAGTNEVIYLDCETSTAGSIGCNVPGTLSAGSNVVAGGFLSSNSGELFLRATPTGNTAEIAIGTDNALHISGGSNGILLNWENGSGGIGFGNGAGTGVGSLDNAGNLSVHGSVTVDNGEVNVAGDVSTDSDIVSHRHLVAVSPTQPLASVQSYYNDTAQAAEYSGTGPNPTTISGLMLAGASSDRSQSTTYLNCTLAGGCNFPVPTTFIGTILVGGSPVCTQATGCPGGAAGTITWPPIGIPVSTGAAWGTSIDPATVPRLNVNNIFTAQQNINMPGTANTSAIEALQPLLPVGGFTQFIIGVDTAANDYAFLRYVNTGTGSTANNLSIGVAGSTTGLHIDANSNLTIPGNVSTTVNNQVTPYILPSASASGGTILGWNSSGNGQGESDFINNDNGAGGGFNWYIAPPGTRVDATVTPRMRLDSSANLAVQGVVSGHAVRGYNYVPVDSTKNQVNIGIGPDGGSPVVQLVHTESGVSGAQMVKWATSTMFQLITSSGVPTATPMELFDNGNLVVTGSITAATKSFRIIDPLDKTKYLTHSSLEGPEIAVFYRGESTTSSGITTITLPEYFEALTRKEDRTVLLTPVFEDDKEEFGQLAASHVVNGKFRVRSTTPSQKFYWEVKAVRADVGPLDVVIDKATEDKKSGVGKVK